MSCFFSLLVLSLLVSPLSSSLVSSLLFPLHVSLLLSFIFSSSLFFSFLFFSFLVLSRLLFSCLVFSFLVLSRLSFSVSLSLSLSLCLSVCLCAVLCGVCGVPVCTFKKTFRVYVQNVPPVYQHHARMCYHMRAWCRYTRGRFEYTHGRFFCTYTRGRGGEEREGRGVTVSSAYQEKPTKSSHLAPQVHRKKLLDLTHSKFENRSRTTRSRVLQSFASPDEPVHFQQS